jgi:hypothetical protein
VQDALFFCGLATANLRHFSVEKAAKKRDCLVYGRFPVLHCGDEPVLPSFLNVTALDCVAFLLERGHRERRHDAQQILALVPPCTR